MVLSREGETRQFPGEVAEPRVATGPWASTPMEKKVAQIDLTLCFRTQNTLWWLPEV